MKHISELTNQEFQILQMAFTSGRKTFRFADGLQVEMFKSHKFIGLRVESKKVGFLTQTAYEVENKEGTGVVRGIFK